MAALVDIVGAVFTILVNSQELIALKDTWMNIGQSRATHARVSSEEGMPYLLVQPLRE